ncbi:MAG TPA: flagellar hook-basal body complex protein [Phycisphaerae bacterium]|jgi:flagellar hook protein FlgE|nr:flagellar hook-basal body complex protein [Phycisphaerae bacterium]HOB74213.1 flagellar hook-basal body complex protein [Phycisphaerae bacterium]HOJ55001.1 flagellar hook-basal body complex protein [Phycisphaerae bacterium]HOL26978.1 flagellar hook-basal body complex protein [Phycisphaerae bacterium]HPP21407.1 flagellar hook-basal body complex protein [Phycisphaerae bacterium]
MSLTSAMMTGLTGLNGNQIRIDNIGNNVSNINTTAFKGARANFENQFALTLAGGTAPNGASGGTNPSQIGMGTRLSSVQRNFSGGPIESTGVPTDMAIDGAGFFIVRTPTSNQAYTRDGTFKLDASQTLVTGQGFPVLGYGVDENFQISPGRLTSLTIPLGAMAAARATTRAFMDGNLNASGAIATQGSIHTTQAFVDGGGAPATGATLLTDLYDPASPGNPLFQVGNTITVDRVSKGGRELPPATYTVTDTSTLDDFASFLQSSLGINTDPAVGGTPGVRVSTTNPPGVGALVIEGNPGADNNLTMDFSSIRSSNANAPTPFAVTSQQEANGESVYTSLIVYDSLGTPVQVDLTMTLESKSDAGNTWRFYATSNDDTGPGSVVGTGTLTFDPDGRLISVQDNTLQISRTGTGAVTPLSVTLDFSNVTGLTSANSSLISPLQDGYPSGVLTDFSVGTDGVITGSFSNGLNRTLGQIALATFTNPEGLVVDANNTYLVGPNSGEAMISAPQSLGAGRVVSHSLELSNVDLTREFIGLITASTGFSASGRIITTSNDLLNELLMIAR